MPKVVFSRTLDESQWPNAVVASDLAGEVTRLKKAGGKDLIARRGAEFVASLLRHRLIDELHLFINLVVLGEGKTIFEQLDGRQALKLVQSRAFPCGIVLLHYAVVVG
jgi:dihydrofolate reductase